MIIWSSIYILLHLNNRYGEYKKLDWQCYRVMRLHLTVLWSDGTAFDSAIEWRLSGRCWKAPESITGTLWTLWLAMDLVMALWHAVGKIWVCWCTKKPILVVHCCLWNKYQHSNPSQWFNMLHTGVTTMQPTDHINLSVCKLIIPILCIIISDVKADTMNSDRRWGAETCWFKSKVFLCETTNNSTTQKSSAASGGW